jgi:phosphatidylinositol alpha 1,6-mannosyltransferase
VVSTAVSGALDVIEDGKNGLLFPPHVPDEMAHAILRVLTDPGFGQLLGASARETIERRYSWSLISQAYINHYRNLLNESST